MTTYTFSVPDWVSPTGTSERTWALVIFLLLVAVLSAAAVEILKRRYNAKQWKKAQGSIEPMAKHVVALLLTAFASIFAGAGYFILFAQANASVLSALPFIGVHMPQVVGTAYLLYNFRLNKTFQKVATVLGKWSKEKPAATGVADPQSAAVPAPVEPPSDSLLS
jgi:hypothetical protein